LEHATAGVPEIVAIGQRQGMDIGANRNRFPRPQDQFSEDVRLFTMLKKGQRA